MASNTILTSGGMQLLRDYLGADLLENAPAPPTYIALSSGMDAISRFMTALPDETFRAPIIYREKAGQTVTYYAFLTDSENQGQCVGGYGLLAGDASPVLNGGGTLVAVANESGATRFWKDSTKTLTVQMSLTVSGSIS